MVWLWSHHGQLVAVLSPLPTRPRTIETGRRINAAASKLVHTERSQGSLLLFSLSKVCSPAVVRWLSNRPALHSSIAYRLDGRSSQSRVLPASRVILSKIPKVPESYDQIPATSRSSSSDNDWTFSFASLVRFAVSIHPVNIQCVTHTVCSTLGHLMA